VTFQHSEAFLAYSPALILQTTQNAKRIRLGIMTIFLNVRATGSLFFGRPLHQI
jgi:hypothetical protein